MEKWALSPHHSCFSFSSSSSTRRGISRRRDYYFAWRAHSNLPASSFSTTTSSSLVLRATAAAAAARKQPNDGCTTGSPVAMLASLLRKLSPYIGNGSQEDYLRRGQWVKLICGASFEDVAKVRNLSLVYTLAGVDCIDCAANPAIVAAVSEGIKAAEHLVEHTNGDSAQAFKKPWVMVSINDDEDLHFRKAEFDVRLCPPDCSRPCERVCPASAIHFIGDGNMQAFPYKNSTDASLAVGGVITERCYGCGRCIPVCPVQNIGAKSYVRSMEAITQLLGGGEVHAIEIHTGKGRLGAFGSLWRELEASLQSLKLVAVSVSEVEGSCMATSLSSIYGIMKSSLNCLNMWQLDGRPMSGDIGKGATMAVVSLAARVAFSPNCPPGFLQLAGGTNFYTLTALRKAGLLHPVNQKDGLRTADAMIAGIAFGGYARKIVDDYFMAMESPQETDLVSSDIVSKHLESYPSLLLEAVRKAVSLVGPIKGFEFEEDT